MYANPSAVQSVRYVREALAATIAPELQSDRAKVLLAMIDTVLASVEKRIPVEQQYMADECSRMSDILRRAAALFAGQPSAAAVELEGLAGELPTGQPLGPLPPFAEINERYALTSDVFTRALGPIHALIAGGDESAPAILHEVRTYLALRLARDMSSVFAMEGGMVGRG